MPNSSTNRNPWSRHRTEIESQAVVILALSWYHDALCHCSTWAPATQLKKEPLLTLSFVSSCHSCQTFGELYHTVPPREARHLELFTSVPHPQGVHMCIRPQRSAIPAPSSPPLPTTWSDPPVGSFPAPPHLQSLVCHDFNVIFCLAGEAVPGAGGSCTGSFDSQLCLHS